MSSGAGDLSHHSWIAKKLLSPVQLQPALRSDVQVTLHVFLNFVVVLLKTLIEFSFSVLEVCTNDQIRLSGTLVPVGCVAIQNWMVNFIQFWMFIVILSLYREIDQKTSIFG